MKPKPETNLIRCLQCRRRIDGICDVDKATIQSHAESGFCPLGRFPADIPDDFNPAQEQARMSQGGCCGTPAKE